MTIAELQQSLAELRTFVARRFDEVSFEINATGQMLGMTEEAMAQRFSEVLIILNAISFRGDGSTPHNVGVELNAVVKTTEDAANKILDAATLISGLTKQNIDWTNAQQREKLLSAINNQADGILTACAFQDLTGQRIAQTLENIRKAESDLTETLKKMGLKIDITPQKTAEALCNPENRATTQADIDALFG
ncbi:MAG: hypothetical protein KBA75_09730 [Alphaproteobacteria bacterium]|nr:hypothetical protein [Alphaproteobacteria bacterium]